MAAAPVIASLDLSAAMRRAGGNPWKYGRYSLDSFQPATWQSTLIRRVRELAGAVLGCGKYDELQGVYACGPNGTGKTLAAHLLLRALLESGVRPGPGVIFDDAATLIARIQDTYNARGSAWDFIDRRIRTRVWILDDLGTENPSDDAARKLSVIFNQREGRPVYVTSNYLIEDMVTRNPEFFRLQARLRGYRKLQVDGPNLWVPSNRATLELAA